MRCDLPNSEVLTLVSDMLQLFLGDDLGFADCDDRVPCGRPDKTPSAGGNGPKTLTGFYVDECERIVAVLGANGYQ